MFAILANKFETSADIVNKAADDISSGSHSFAASGTFCFSTDEKPLPRKHEITNANLFRVCGPETSWRCHWQRLHIEMRPQSPSRSIRN